MSYRIGVDIGGTFTDFTVVDRNGEMTLWKQDTNPAAPTQAIEAGLHAVAGELGKTLQELLSETVLFVHGTTIATNTLIQRNGPKVGLLCTKGFRDVLYLRDGFKPERFNIHMEHPGTFVDRYLRLGVPGRIGPSGVEITPLDEDAVRDAARVFKAEKVDSIAIGFLWSILNPAHEQRAKAILAEELPELPAICSSDVLPEIREWERTSSAVLSAYVLPGIKDYLASLEKLLASSGYGRGPLIMQINGGCASVQEIIRRPVNVLASGPAAAPAAAAALVSGQDDKNVITIDMGGTSLDVCLIRDGRATMSRNVQVEEQPIGVPAVEVRSIGAGGGSIGWIDNGGALRVGPRSAGARPGPAAYGAGGTEPTVTDANVVLGLLEPSAFLGGRRQLDKQKATDAVVRRIGDPLGISAIEAAAGMIRVVNANMVGAIRGVSVERGIDPRGFTLVAGGGAGGLHAVGLARELGMRSVMIPREAGTLCSFGMIVTDVRLDETATAHALSDSGDFAAADVALAGMEQRVRERLRANGIKDEAVTIERYVDARYPGQVHELTIRFPDDTGGGAKEYVPGIARSFHDEHKQQFTYSRPEMSVEFLHWRVVGIGRMAFAPKSVGTKMSGDRQGALREKREAYSVVAGRMVPMDIYDAQKLSAGATVPGPAVLEVPTTTILVDEGDTLVVRSDGGFEIAVAVRP